MTTEQRLAIAAPRGHAKSTWFTLVYVLWCILFKKRNFIVLVSDTAGQASDLLGTIIEELETNETIIKDFGKIAGYIPPTAEDKKKWNSKDIVTLTDVKVIARGWNARIRGIRYKQYRPDLVILDDVENDENVQNEDQRSKVKKVFKNSILNLGSHDTQIMVIGTILHFDSLLMDLLNNPPTGWHTRLYKAIEDNEPLWPEWWSIEALEAKKADIGSISFEQEYMNNPLDPSTQIIAPKDFYQGDVDLTMVDCFGYLDPAISEKETADYAAIGTIGRHRITGKLYVIEPVRMRGNVDAIMELVFKMHLKYKYVAFGVESVALQKVLAQIITSESRKRNIYLPVIEVEIDKDKVRRAIEITPHVENGTVLFNAQHQEFLAEVIQFPKAAHDDYVDSFVGAVKLAITNGSNNGKILTGGKIRYNE
jgi:predicted phage terminase large subunit-like protein